MDISEQEKNIILQSRKNFLFKNGEYWVKRKDSEFDVTQGGFDAAEVADIVGLFMLSELEKLKLKATWTSYKDDGLGVSDATPRQVENMKKKVCQVFNKNGLEITVEANKKIVQYLDVELNLSDESFKPFIKPNDIPLYVNANSNHPKAIKKNIPEAVNRRLSALSSSEEMFKSSAPVYQTALDDAGYSFQLKYSPMVTQDGGGRKRTRKRHILWFNPPYSADVRTNVGAKFLKLIDKHFPKSNPLNKIINRNTCKISYRTTPNMKHVIAAHNAKVLNKQTESVKRKCSCPRGSICPLDGECLSTNIVYQATVTPTNPPAEAQTYVGLTANTFKQRLGNHKKSFNHRQYRTDTTLSDYIWKLKDDGIQYDLKWKIIDKARPFSPVTGICALCTLEKFYIIFKPELATINKKEEINNYCLHKTPVLLDKT